MKKLLIPCFILCSCFSISAITVSAQSCPTLTVIAPSDDVDVGKPMTFSTNVTGGDPNVTPTYNWTISSGTISAGQGTSAITVDTTGLNGIVTATVDVGGYGRTCITSRSATAFLKAVLVEARKFDEFNYLGPAKLEYARLDMYADALRNEPDAGGHLIMYLGRKGLPGAIKAWADQTVTYLAKKGVAKTRITVVDGGYREAGMLELWILPPGATAPYPTPNVDPSEIMPPKRANKPAGKKT